jgi:eukaryotic-like serine/threonine-protein kinase
MNQSGHEGDTASAGETASVPGPDDLAIARFLKDLDEAPEPDEVVRRHAALHPHLAGEFEDLAAMRDRIKPPPADAPEEHRPERLGDFRIIGEIGRGGMGMIYEAVQEPFQRRVAVKTVRGDLQRVSSTTRARFLREQTVLAKLHHTHIVPIHAAGHAGSLHYFAMQYIEGAALSQVVTSVRLFGSSSPTGETPSMGELAESAERKREQRMATTTQTDDRPGAVPPSTDPEVAPAPPPIGSVGAASDESSPLPNGRLHLSMKYLRSVAKVMADAADALQHAHDVNICHRDVKPSNIMVDRKEHCWVVDFGLAALRPSADGPGRGRDGKAPAGSAVEPVPDPEPDPHLTDRTIGTIPYMAPEQFDRRADRLTDVWGLGVTLYELLTLSRPFRSKEAILSDHPTRPRDLVTDLPRDLEAICLKAIRKDPGERYPSAGAFRDDLRRWLDHEPTRARPARVVRRVGLWSRRNPGWAAAIIVALIAGTATATAAFRINLQDLQAKKRELNLISVSRLRASIRPGGWFEEAWVKTRELAGGRPDDDGRFQGQFAALLDGLDVRLAKSFAMNAAMLAFDPEGKRLLMGQFIPDDRGRPITAIAIGDLAGQSGPTEKRFESVGVVGFGPDGGARFLELDPVDHSILRLRDAITGAEIRAMKSPRNGASTVVAQTLARDGSRAAGVVWPLRKRTPEEMAANPDKTSEMTTVGDTATLVVWDLSTGRVIRAIEEKQTPSHDVVLSPDGSLLATWDLSGRLHQVAVWSVDDGALLGRFSSTRSAITSVAFGPDPSWHDDDKGPRWRLAVGEHGGMITVWETKTRAVKSLARGSAYDVKTMDFRPDGALLASAGRNELRIWDTASGTCLLRVPAGSYQLAVAFSPDGRRLAVGKMTGFGFAGGVDVYDLEEGRGLRTLRGLQQRIEKIAISADGRRVAALSNDWELGVFDKASGALLGVTAASEGFFTDNAALALNADGTRLVCSGGTEAKLWDVEKKRLLRRWKLPPALTEAAGFRPDGRLILIRQETQGAKLPPGSQAHPKDHPRFCRAYELPEQGDPKKTAEIADFNWYVEHIAATPDAAYFAVQGLSSKTGKLERILHVYDGSTGKSVGEIPTTIPPVDWATWMRFDPKGTRLHVRRDARDPDRHDLFEVPSLKSVGGITMVACVNVGGSRWVSLLSQTPDTPATLVLRKQGRLAPLLRIVRDVGVTGTDGLKFSPDGNHIVWGNQDGTVTVCDLNEVQRRLAGVGLGW